jgi:hypothetical protein
MNIKTEEHISKEKFKIFIRGLQVCFLIVIVNLFMFYISKDHIAPEVCIWFAGFISFGLFYQLHKIILKLI